MAGQDRARRPRPLAEPVAPDEGANEGPTSDEPCLEDRRNAHRSPLTAEKRETRAVPYEPADRAEPVLSIYQNAEQVAGLVQQLFDSPLVEALTTEAVHDDSKQRQIGGKASTTGEAGARVPGIGRVEGRGAVEGNSNRTTVIATQTKQTQSFVYSQAYYLNVVRSNLADRGLLQTIDSLSSTEGLRAGSWIEYEARFRPSVLTTLMDVVTPRLIREATRYLAKKQEIDSIDFSSRNSIDAGAARLQLRADANGELAFEIAEAAKADFRQDSTREYFGDIVSEQGNLTAVTICDTEHFLTKDHDRILDGQFSVLGKLISTPAVDVPILERNKLLRSITPEGVDALVEALRAAFTQQGSTNIGGLDVEQLLELDLNSRISGPSISVIPIAIYA